MICFVLHVTDYRKWMNENYPSILEGKYGDFSYKKE